MEALEAKIIRQLALEDEAVTLGVEKYNKELLNALAKEQGALVRPVTELIKKCIEPTMLAIDKERKNSRGRNAELMQILNLRLTTKGTPLVFDSITLAFETARVLFNFYSKGTSLTKLAIEIANTLLADCNYIEFIKAEHTWLAPDGEVHIITGKSYVDNVVKTKLSQGTQKGAIMNVLRGMMGKRDVIYNKWNTDFKLRLGMKLINALVESTGLFEIKKDYKGSLIVEATPEVTVWLEHKNSILAVLSPIMMPMIVKPIEWAGLYGGGYLSAHKGLKNRLVRARNSNTIEALKDLSMPNVYKAVNSIQGTPWKINSKLLEVAQHIWEHSLEVADIPSKDTKSVPAKPWGDLTDSEWTMYKDTNPEDVKRWKEQARAVYNDNSASMSKRISVAAKLTMANRFVLEDEIYFTCYLDWRGRIYFTQSDMSPQSDDLGKALIHFAKGKALGDTGARWLAIHGANTAGVDKVSFDDRVQWVKDNEVMIVKTGNDPLDTIYWWGDELGADKPFGFVAFCIEWTAYLQQGNTFVSHIPIALDGSCNGIQHLSAMLKDERGGRAVNLLPSDKPNDIYQEVADEVTIAVNKDHLEGIEIATSLKDSISRTLVKRNVMTTPYGATRRGMIDQLIVDHKLYRDAATYIADKNYLAISQVVVAARGAMGWFQDVVKVLADHELPIIWVTPSGFKVYHAYEQVEQVRINSYWGKLRLQMWLNKEVPNTVSKSKQASGIAPNMVHSFDAAHLQNTVCTCETLGIESFAMIHDSFGTHACDTDLLSAVLRDEFVKMYSGDVLNDLYKQVKAQVPPEVCAELPLLPSLGTLDITAVVNSPYFFA